MTPRIICGDYESDADKTVEIASSGDNKKVNISVFGSKEFDFKIEYEFEGDKVKIKILTEKDAVYSLPIIADKNAEINMISPNEMIFRNMLKVSSNVNIKTEDLSKRYFNQVGGFQYFPLKISLTAGKTTEIIMEI